MHYQNVYNLILQRKLEDLTVKFQKFQRPADFEPKQNHVKRELDNIQERIYLLEIHGDDLDTLQAKHDQCMVRGDNLNNKI